MKLTSMVIGSLAFAYKKVIKVAWQKPKKGWVKLNFDGSLNHKTGIGSIGGVFRNHKGNFLLGYAARIDQCTSTHAEMAALLRGLELVVQNGWLNLWVEGDAKSVLDVIIAKRKFKCARAQKFLTCIDTILHRLNAPIVTHVHREGNRAADKLAGLGHLVDNKTQIWKKPPSELVPILGKDAGGPSSCATDENRVQK